MSKYYTIKSNSTASLIVKKSTFNSFLYKVTSINDVELILNDITLSNKKARHICFAYIIDNNHKYFDDNEPKNTAGLPIYTILTKNKLNNVLCVVVRYFGGILLGSSKLYKAYMDSSLLALNSNKIIQLDIMKIYILEFDYDIINNINALITNDYIINKEFLDIIRYRVNITDDIYKQLIEIKNLKISKEN